ncbi:MAG: hypothetical protein EAX95_05900 [Candidatus Thorarchaeota archaeon]|nr:hypothetical protein [Candidatus Thorarchaeota archaeon]
MEEQIATTKSLSSFYALFVVFALLETAAGYVIGVFLPPADPVDLLAWFVLYLALPVGVALLGAFIGWKAKKNAIIYRAPEWALKPVQYRIDEFLSFIRDHHRKYTRMEARSHYWFFQLPILTMILLSALPFYVLQFNPPFAIIVPAIFSAGLLLIHVTSVVGAFLSTENEASADFTLPLVREALWLAKEQSKVTGVSEVHVVVDLGKHGEFETVRNPRVVTRIEGVEDAGYMESWSEDLRALTRMFCRLNPSNAQSQVIWWWLSQERLFRKYTESEKEGYFVKFPVPFLGKDLGVRDVKLVTANAIGIMLLEIVRHGNGNDNIRKLLDDLNVAPEIIESAQNA